MSKEKPKRIAVLGAGSWGSTLALYLAKRTHDVLLWTYEKSHAEIMRNERVNTRYLPGFIFPSNLTPTILLEELFPCDYILVATPSKGFRTTLISLKKIIKDKINIIWATKGLDETTGGLLHETALEILGKDNQYAVLAGPTFALEVAKGLPTAAVIASSQKYYANELLNIFNSELFRIYLSNDVIGVEVCGVVKNVMAIGAGIIDGMLLGANARSALITRGLHEMTKLGIALGGLPETFIGLAGIGDLVLTCTDNQSRNRQFGLAIGNGLTIKKAAISVQQVIEGKHNAEMILQLAKKHNIEMPITATIVNILNGTLNLQEAMKSLLMRQTALL